MFYSNRAKNILIKNLFLTLCYFLVGCYHHAAVKTTHPLSVTPYKKIAQTRSLSSYNHIMMAGPFNVNLHTGYRHPQITLQGDERDLQQVITQIRNHTLFVTVGKGYPKYGPLTADIRTRELNSFVYNGMGTIKGTQLNSRALYLSIANPGSTQLGGHIALSRLAVYGNSQVQLSGVYGYNTQIVMTGHPHIQLVGVFNLNTLNLYGDGFLSGYWVKNDRLVVKEHDRVHVQLAGVANVLEVELWGKSDFNGRYLRANRAFVRTHDQSVAKLSAVSRQHTLATDGSDIYFYNLPEMRADFMAYNGAVLDMRDWNMISTQEYTRYNK